MFNLFKRTPALNVKEIDNIKNKHRIIDIRNKKELMQYGKIKGIRHIEMNSLLENPEKHLDKDKEYYLMCQSGIRSKKAVKQLNKAGFNTINLKGGFYYYDRF